MPEQTSGIAPPGFVNLLVCAACGRANDIDLALGGIHGRCRFTGCPSHADENARPLRSVRYAVDDPERRRRAKEYADHFRPQPPEQSNERAPWWERVNCVCSPDDGSHECPRMDECFAAWHEDRDQELAREADEQEGADAELRNHIRKLKQGG